jgi:hypothetical protein
VGIQRCTTEYNREKSQSENEIENGAGPRQSMKNGSAED